MTVIVATLVLVWIRLLWSIRRTASSLYPRSFSTGYRRQAASTASFCRIPSSLEIFLARAEKFTMPILSPSETLGWAAMYSRTSRATGAIDNCTTCPIFDNFVLKCHHDVDTLKYTSTSVHRKNWLGHGRP